MPRPRILLLTLAVMALLTACSDDSDKPAPATTTFPPGTTVVPQPAPEENDPAARIVDIALNNGATIRVYVDVVEKRGGIHIVRYEVENIGKQPADTRFLVAEVEDDKGRRFEEEAGTVQDTPGTLNPTEAGVVTTRFDLPDGAEPKVLYLSELGGGEPAPIQIP